MAVLEFDANALEQARKLFAGPCDFKAGVTSMEILPAPTLPEIGFVGRSNVGKSSLINALTGRTTLAKISHTPGRTQQLNFFLLSELVYLVDMPGYGYAAVGKKLREHWGELILAYLKGRVTLKRVYVLVDGRHGLKESDFEMMRLLDQSALSYQIILTKMDKVNFSDRQKRLDDTYLGLKKHPAAYPEILICSAHKGEGIPEVRANIHHLMLQT